MESCKDGVRIVRRSGKWRQDIEVNESVRSTVRARSVQSLVRGSKQRLRLAHLLYRSSVTTVTSYTLARFESTTLPT